MQAGKLRLRRRTCRCPVGLWGPGLSLVPSERLQLEPPPGQTQARSPEAQVPKEGPSPHG